MLRRLALRHPLRASQTDLQIKFHGVDPLTLLRSVQKENRWTTFTPPAAGLSRRYRGRILHRRSQIDLKHIVSDVPSPMRTLDIVMAHPGPQDVVELRPAEADEEIQAF